MLSRSYHIATLYRRAFLGSAILLNACAVRGADRPVTNTEPQRAPVTAVRESYVVDTPEFALVTSSSAAKTTALEALRGSVATFQWLFDNPAPHIGVVVADARTMSPPDAGTVTRPS